MDREGEWRRRDKGESLPPDSVVTGGTASSLGGQTLYERDGEDGTEDEGNSDVFLHQRSVNEPT